MVTERTVLNMNYSDYIRKRDIAKRLIATCEKAAMKYGYNTCTVRGVSNLSRSDLDSIVFYCETYIESGTLGGLMTPRGGVGSVLKKAQLI